jgi:four helix bundle protein
MKSFRDLEVWQQSMTLAKEVYRVTRTFPREEIFGLTSQMRRAAVSIPSNIAEGASRQSTKEFVQFLHVAIGSVNELDTQLEIAQSVVALNKNDQEKIQTSLVKVRMLLHGLTRSLRTKSTRVAAVADHGSRTTGNRQPATDNRQRTTDS